MVFARGTVPCDVLFIGEAPGKSEDVAGLPFWGPSGEKLDWIVRRSVAPFGLTWAMTNMVCCIPRKGAKTEKPPPEAIDACTPRLQEFVAIAEPRLIVCVGATARDMLSPDYLHTVRFERQIPQCHITHPGYIIKQPVAQQGLLLQQATVAIINALEDYSLIGPAEEGT